MSAFQLLIKPTLWYVTTHCEMGSRCAHDAPMYLYFFYVFNRSRDQTARRYVSLCFIAPHIILCFGSINNEQQIIFYFSSQTCWGDEIPLLCVSTNAYGYRAQSANSDKLIVISPCLSWCCACALQQCRFQVCVCACVEGGGVCGDCRALQCATRSTLVCKVEKKDADAEMGHVEKTMDHAPSIHPSTDRQKVSSLDWR